MPANKFSLHLEFYYQIIFSSFEIFFCTLFLLSTIRSSHPDVFPAKRVLKICSKFTGEHPCRSAISIKLQSNFIKIALRYGCSPVNFLNVFRTPFLKNTSGRLLLNNGDADQTRYRIKASL